MKLLPKRPVKNISAQLPRYVRDREGDYFRRYEIFGVHLYFPVLGRDERRRIRESDPWEKERWERMRKILTYSF